jgi:hypothetical protein
MKRQSTTVFLLLLLAAVCTGRPIQAQEQPVRHWTFTAFAGYNLGGTTPLPLPPEIRKIDSWSPGFSGTLAIHATRWINSKWGITSGLGIDLKGMTIRADVKYMMTHLVVGQGDNTGSFSGMFSGKNKTKVRNGYVVLPLLAAWRPVDRWTFRLGGYLASMRDARFEGTASDGHIRNGGPAGDRINIESATFDFSENVKKADAGLMASADWFFSRKMAVCGQLSWGLVPIFPADFNGIPYKMYNVYFTTGVAYKL